MKKNNNHHKVTHHNTHQLGLNMEIAHPIVPRLNDYQKQFIGLFFNNSEIAITQKQLFECSSCHENTINRFIKKALSLGWIRQVKIIIGARINNVYMDYKEPDKLETGQLIHDHRYTFYQITEVGKSFYEKFFL